MDAPCADRSSAVLGLALALLLAAIAAYGAFQAPDRPGGPRVRLATTTSTENSGLLAHLLPRFTAETGIAVDVIAVGTGRALALGAAGDADIVLVHAREREDAFVAAGHATARHGVCYNDFVLLGPPSDPAGVRGLDDVHEAFRRVAATATRFVTRGDDSGTHIREQALWQGAGVEPGGDWLVDAGAGMGRCLLVADERRAMVLCDRGTWLAFRGRLDLVVLLEGDPRLRNPYGAMVVDPTRHPGVAHAAATRLLRFLVSPAGQAAIAAFRRDGVPLFHPNADP